MPVAVALPDVGLDVGVQELFKGYRILRNCRFANVWRGEKRDLGGASAARRGNHVTSASAVSSPDGGSRIVPAAIAAAATVPRLTPRVRAYSPDPWPSYWKPRCGAYAGRLGEGLNRPGPAPCTRSSPRAAGPSRR